MSGDGFDDLREAGRADAAVARAFGRKPDLGSVSEADFDAVFQSTDMAIASAFGRPTGRDAFSDLREADQQVPKGNVPALRSELVGLVAKQNEAHYPDRGVGQRMAEARVDSLIETMQEWGVREGWSREQLESRLAERIAKVRREMKLPPSGLGAPAQITEADIDTSFDTAARRTNEAVAEAFGRQIKES